MLLRTAVAAQMRWRDLTRKDERERGDSPVPTVIMWIGIAIIAVGLVTWAGTYVLGFTNAAPSTVKPPTP
jgi:hypothetical protein